MHREPERRLLQAALVDLDRLEVLEQRRAVVPLQPVAALDHVVALEAGEWDADAVLDADLRGQLRVLLLELPEALLGVVDEIHLVDRDRDMPDPEQRHQVAVPARLRQQPLARVDQDHRAVRGRGAGDHVPRVLLVPGRVGDDELAPVGREVAVGDVDRDPLLALGREAVEQQREVEIVALRPDLLRVDLERRELVLEQHLRLEEQPSDQRALAVVDAAAGDEAQHALALVRLQVGEDVLGEQVGAVHHQKYPSCFFFSIEPLESKSITRPWRSDVRASSISWITAGSVSASLSIAPVSG